MKNTKEIGNRESLKHFKIVENFLNSESAITELSKIIEEFNIPRKLSIFQDVFEVDYDGDYKYGDIPKYKYTNLFKYLKENLPEINEFIPGSQYSGDQHVGVMKTCDNIRADRSINVIVSKIADELKGVSVSFDINKSKLLLSKKYNNNLNNRLEINFEKNTGKFNCNLLPLFDLEVLVRPFIDVISDQQTVSLAFLQYISGIIDSEKLSTYIVSEIKFNLSEIVTNFTIGEDQVDLSKYPANFYTDEEIHSIFFGSDVNFKSIIRGSIPSFLASLKSNDKIRRVLLSEHQLNNISVDMLHYFIKTDYYDLIPWYSDLNRESRLKLLFNTFDDIEENSNANTIPIDVITKILTDDELFSIAKKYYKNLLNSLLTGKHTKAAQDYSCIELSLNELTKKVKINGHKFHLRITEEQLSELKSELLPLLKQAQNLFVYKLYESHSDKEWVSREISKKLNGCNPEEFWVYSSAGLDRIDRRLDFLTDHTTISFDVKRLQFVFAETKEVHGVYYQIDLESGELNTHLLPLFNFSFLCSLQSMAARLDDRLVLLFMKNACGLLSNESLATELISEIKSNLIQVVEDWTINFNDGELHLDRFPIDFYDPDFLNQKLSTENYFEFSKLLDSKQDKEITRSNPKKKIRKMFYFGKFKKYYKDFLVQLIEGKIDFNKYPYSTLQDREFYHCSEDEISELKRELIPLLEKAEAEGKIFVNPYYYFHHYTPEKGAGGKNFVKYCCNQSGILMKLFDLLDWYPNKFGIYELVFSNGLLVKDLELYSYIKYASKVEGFDYKIFIELRNNSDCNWPIRKKVQLNNIAKKILGNGTIFDPDDKNISDEQKVSSDYNLYNKSIEPKFIFKK